MKNPFTPNFGQVPMYIAGRTQEIAEVLSALDDLGSPARTAIFVGARGSGKTALLTYLASEAGKKGWISVNTGCLPGIREDILQQISIMAKELLPLKKETKVTGLSIGQLFSIEWEKETGVKANWRTRITEILELLEEHGTGLLITIDEVDPGLDEMIQIASVYQLLVRENRKIVLLMAGLPSEVSALLSDRSVSFLRRASQYTLGRVDDYEVREAFRKTIEESGRQIDPAALEAAVKAIAGFPYMLQLVGYRVWAAAGDDNRINMEAAEKGIQMAIQDFRSRVLRTTVGELSEGDLMFLKAMLPDEGASKVSDLEKRMEKSSGYISRYRARLIEAGVIEPAGRGKVVFALPDLKEYLKEKHPQAAPSAIRKE